jgi:hypothetical protein
MAIEQANYMYIILTFCVKNLHTHFESNDLSHYWSPVCQNVLRGVSYQPTDVNGVYHDNVVNVNGVSCVRYSCPPHNWSMAI